MGKTPGRYTGCLFYNLKAGDTVCSRGGGVAAAEASDARQLLHIGRVACQSVVSDKQFGGRGVVFGRVEDEDCGGNSQDESRDDEYPCGDMSGVAVVVWSVVGVGMLIMVVRSPVCGRGVRVVVLTCLFC